VLIAFSVQAISIVITSSAVAAQSARASRLQGQELPTSDRPYAGPRLLVVLDEREIPAQLDHGRQLAALVERPADRGAPGERAIGVVDADLPIEPALDLGPGVATCLGAEAVHLVTQPHVKAVIPERCDPHVDLAIIEPLNDAHDDQSCTTRPCAHAGWRCGSSRMIGLPIPVS
jgi:hypothetical protein